MKIYGDSWTTITWSDKTVIWRSADAYGQLNASGQTYDYVAFG